MADKRLQAKENLIECLKRRGLYEEKDGIPIQHAEPIYASYDDRMSEEDAVAVLRSEHPEDTFLEIMDRTYDCYIDEERWSIVQEAMKGVYPKDEEEERYLIEYLQEELYELLIFDMPYDHYLDQEFNADLMIDTGDANYDFACNSVYPHYYGVKGSGIEKEASLVWLAGTQGYTKSQLEEALDDGDLANPTGFLESVRQEVANETSSMNCLTFLVKMTLRDLIELNRLIRLQEPDGEKIFEADLRPDCGTLKISRKASPGLYDPWNGAGSVFEIELEKDIVLPIRYIRSCLPDSEFTWSVRSVYGMCSSAWQDVVSDISEPATA